MGLLFLFFLLFFFQAEDGIRDLVRSRGLGDVYKRQIYHNGLAVMTQNLGSFTPLTSYNLHFGKRASGPFLSLIHI